MTAATGTDEPPAWDPDSASWRHGEPRQRMGAGRRAARILVPLVFIGGVVALVILINQSGILQSSSMTSPSPSVSPSVKVAMVYIVKRGDTLSEIAARHNVTVQAIHDLNPKIDANNLRVRSKIKIPAPTE